MRIKQRIAIVVLVISCFLVFTYTRTGCAQKAARNRRVTPPKGLLNQLASDDNDAANFINQELTDEPSQRFTVELVDLNRDGKPEFIVLPPLGMMGSNSGPIWVYRQTPNGFKQLLRAAFMSYRVLPRSHNGFHDFETTYGGNRKAVDVFWFDGNKYVLR
jgi:hypothetical protein